MDWDKFFNNAGKALNTVGNVLAKRVEEVEENQRRYLKKCSDEEIKRYCNRKNLNDRTRGLVEEEAKRRRIRW